MSNGTVEHPGNTTGMRDAGTPGNPDNQVTSCKAGNRSHPLPFSGTTKMYSKLLPLALAAFVSTSAFATPDVKTFTINAPLETFGTAGWTSSVITHPANRAFEDSFVFTIGGMADVDYGYTLNTRGGKYLELTQVTLKGDGYNIVKTGSATELSSFTFDGLLGGTYTLTLAGLSTGKTGGQYQVTIGAAPVPEPEALALALAGLGVAGFVARRKQA